MLCSENFMKWKSGFVRFMLKLNLISSLCCMFYEVVLLSLSDFKAMLLARANAAKEEAGEHERGVRAVN
jgi:hypothetical protein